MDPRSTNVIISGLEKSIDSLDAWLALTTGLVVLGLVLEYWHEIPESVASLRRSWSWRPALIIAGGILITIGVAGELGIQFKLSQLDDRLRIQNHQALAPLVRDAEEARAKADSFESQISSSNAKAEEAKAKVALAEASVRDAVARVAGADARIAEAELAAAQAREKAEAERLERERLEALVSPRRLTLDQQRAIGAACVGLYKNGPANRVRVESYGLDGEGAALAQQIIGALSSAHLYNESSIADIIQTGEFETGVLIHGPPEDQRFLECLDDSLRRIGGLEVSLNGATHEGG